MRQFREHGFNVRLAKFLNAPLIYQSTSEDEGLNVLTRPLHIGRLLPLSISNSLVSSKARLLLGTAYINCKFHISPFVVSVWPAFRCSPAFLGRVVHVSRLRFLISLTLFVSPTLVADQPGGRFGFSYPNLNGVSSDMTAAQFVGVFDAVMHNPNVYQQWINNGTDIRKLNPSGAYLKHLNLRTIDGTQREPSIEGRPDYDWIHANHPEWILRDANGNTIPMFVSTEESLDFGNPAYLDWAFGQWFPRLYSGSKGFLDSTDSDPNLVTWYLQDEGVFLRQYINCAPSDAVCNRYNSDAGVQSAFKTMFDKFHQYFPNKKILINTGVLSYMTPAQQLPWMKDVLSHADGYFSEYLTNDHAYWNNQPNSDKRNALQATLQLFDWLAANGKYCFPHLGLGDTTEPTQAETDYAFAFFNLARSGDRQFFSKVTKDASGEWVPRTYPEMTAELGAPTGPRQEIQTNVYRRAFDKAIAYVNLSDNPVSINLPSGTNYKNSVGKAISSPLTLASFSGLTVYGSNAQPSPTPAIPPQPPTNLRVLSP